MELLNFEMDAFGFRPYLKIVFLSRLLFGLESASHFFGSYYIFSVFFAGFCGLVLFFGDSRRSFLLALCWRCSSSSAMRLISASAVRTVVWPNFWPLRDFTGLTKRRIAKLEWRTKLTSSWSPSADFYFYGILKPQKLIQTYATPRKCMKENQHNQ